MHTDNASQRGLGRDRRLGAGARRAGGLRPQMLHVARRAQQLLLRLGSPGAGTRSASRSTHGAGANGLRAMVPTSSCGRSADRRHARRRPDPSHDSQTIKGVEYAFFDADRRRLRGDLRRRRHRAGDLQRRRLGPRATAPPTITWDTDEASDLPGRLRNRSEQPGPEPEQPGAGHLPQRPAHRPRAQHHLPLPGDVRRRRDARAQLEHPPAPPADPASFTTPSATFTDTTVSDFGAGTPDANTYISETDNGEVILKPTEGQEFSGSRRCRPAGRAAPGELRRERHARDGATGLRRQPPRQRRLRRHRRHLRPRAARSSSSPPSAPPPFQHVGFTDDFKPRLGDLQHQGRRQHQLYARTNNGQPGLAGHRSGSGSLVGISTPATGSSGARARSSYYVDGNPDPVATHTVGFGLRTCVRPPATSTPAAPS